jgi:hypothetical protein
MRKVLGRIEAELPGAGGPATESVGWMGGADHEVLRGVANDRGRPRTERLAALRLLAFRLRTEREFADTVIGLLDDSDPVIVQEAIRSSPPFDARIGSRLKGLVDDPREEVWTEAASVLARRKDRALLARLVVWLREGDRPHRRMAVSLSAWLLDLETRLTFLERCMALDKLDDDDRAFVAAAIRETQAQVDSASGGPDEESGVT